jgi:electron transfer flavoprotein beta subunit
VKVLVPVKRVVDYNVKVRVRSDNSGVDLNGVKMAINPFDEIAVEEAVRLRESQQASEVIVVSCGGPASQETLRTALAMGADRAILVESDAELQPLAVAKLLKAVVDREQPSLVICGKQAIDDDANQTGQMLAALMGAGQATFASKLVVNGGAIHVTREGRRAGDAGPGFAGGRHRRSAPQRAALRHPAQHHEGQKEAPRGARRRRPGRRRDPAPAPRAPRRAGPRKGGVKVADVAELVSKLKNEAKVI